MGSSLGSGRLLGAEMFQLRGKAAAPRLMSHRAGLCEALLPGGASVVCGSASVA